MEENFKDMTKESMDLTGHLFLLGWFISEFNSSLKL
jgi:hypothetical protein